MKYIRLLLITLLNITSVEAQIQDQSISLSGNNPIGSVNNFYNKIEFTGRAHGAIVFNPGQTDELMFGMHNSGNFYWGTGRSHGVKPNFYALRLDANTGNLFVMNDLLMPGKIKIDSHDDNQEFLRFESDRPWVFKNYGTSQNSRLVLESQVSSKFFDIGLKDSPNIVASFFPHSIANEQKIVLVENGGNVGIGTSSPEFKLDVNGITKANALSLTGRNPIGSVNNFYNKIEFKGLPHGAIVFNPGEIDELMFGMHTSGNFYWGTGRSHGVSPNFYAMELDGKQGNLKMKGSLIADKNIYLDGQIKVDSHGNNQEFLRFESDRPWVFKNYGTSADSRLVLESQVNSKFFDIGLKDSSNKVASFFTSNNANAQKIVLVKDGGKVGIGTSDPKNELSVNGHIWAKEVKVSLSDAADWVFNDDYKLRPLAEVASYIEENKHLPEIPSAEEFRKNDLKVSEMTNKLLQKIEELTLYTIEQEKKLEEMKTLKKRIAKLESLLIK